MKTMKRTLCLLLVLATVCSLCVGSASAASTAPYADLSTSKYATVYTLATSGKVIPYTTSDLSQRGSEGRPSSTAYIDCKNDDLRLFAVGVNSSGKWWAKVSYPINGSNTRRTAYIHLSEITANTHAVKTTATGKFYCAVRKGWGTDSKYYVAKGDTVYLLALSEDGKQVQIKYPVANGRFRIAWASRADYEKYCGPISNEPVDVTAQFAGKTITMLSVENGKYLCADANASGTPLRANKDWCQTWETFTVSALTSDGWVGFKTHNGNNLSAMADTTDTPLGAKYGNLQSWECFRIYQKGSDYYLKAQINNKWVCVRVDKPEAPVQAYANAPSTWERLNIRIVPGKIEQAVQSRLDEIANGSRSYNSSTVMQVGKTFTGYRASEQCKGYAKNVFYLCFKIQPGSTQDRAKGLNYLLNSTTGMTKLGSVTNKNTSDLEALFAKARPGDFVQMRRSHGGSHSAIVYNVTAQGVTFLEANLDNKNTVSMNHYTWADLAKNAAMGVYTASNYQLK